MRELSGLRILDFPTQYPLRDRELAQAVCDLKTRSINRGLIGDCYGTAYVREIVRQTLRKSGHVPLHATDYKDPLPVSSMKLVLDFVYANVSESSLCAAVLADLAGLQVDTFRHRFKRSFQRSVYQFVLDVRMECAAEQLMSTRKQVSQIAMDTGFADHSYFCKAFRSRIGQSLPSTEIDICGRRKRKADLNLRSPTRKCGFCEKDELSFGQYPTGSRAIPAQMRSRSSAGS